MPGRIRTIKPEWLDDELLSMCSGDARTLSVALILLADDYGNGRCHPPTMAPRVFPSAGDSPESLLRPSVRWQESLRELLEIRFVGLYEKDGQHYFSVRNWDKHQKVNHPSKPLVPPPPDDLWGPSSRESQEGFKRPARESQETLLPDLRPRPTTNDQYLDPRARTREAEPEPAAHRPRPADRFAASFTPDDPAALALFEVWKSEAGKPAAKLDHKRSELFQRLAIEGVTAADVKTVVTGAKLDDWARDKAKLDPSAILGSAGQREKFAELAKCPPKPQQKPKSETADWILG